MPNLLYFILYSFKLHLCQIKVCVQVEKAAFQAFTTSIQLYSCREGLCFTLIVTQIILKENDLTYGKS